MWQQGPASAHQRAALRRVVDSSLFAVAFQGCLCISTSGNDANCQLSIVMSLSCLHLAINHLNQRCQNKFAVDEKRWRAAIEQGKALYFLGNSRVSLRFSRYTISLPSRSPLWTNGSYTPRSGFAANLL